jgi:cytochrome c oxidase subunit 2
VTRLWSLFALVVVIFGVLTFILGAQNNIWLPEDHSLHGSVIDKLFYFILVLTGIVFVATEGCLFYFLWKYSGSHNKEPIKYTHGSHTLEIIWTIIPAATLLFIAIYQFNSWAEAKMRNPIFGDDGIQGTQDDMSFTVEVTARQWEWRIRYPGADGKLGTEDDLFTVNELHVPANENVVISLKSADVLHSFFIPEMRLKQDAVPGTAIPVWFFPKKKPDERNYEVDIVCAEHCGARHYAMKGRVWVEDRDTYDQWIKKLTDRQNAKTNSVATSSGEGK